MRAFARRASEKPVFICHHHRTCVAQYCTKHGRGLKEIGAERPLETDGARARGREDDEYNRKGDLRV